MLIMVAHTLLAVSIGLTVIALISAVRIKKTHDLKETK